MAALPLSGSEFAFLGALLRNDVQFMIVGLSAAALQGAPVVTEDVDLWFENLADPKLRLALNEVGAAYVPPFELYPPMFTGSGTELFDIVLRMDGLGKFPDELQHCVRTSLALEGLKVLSIDRILVSKRAANRPKDKLVIPVLEDVLAVAKALKSTESGKLSG